MEPTTNVESASTRSVPTTVLAVAAIALLGAGVVKGGKWAKAKFNARKNQS